MALTQTTKNRIKSGLITLTAITSFSIAGMLPSHAAIEIDETDFGPSYGRMAVDTVVGKPLQLVTALAGTATYVVSLPFSIIGGNMEQAQQRLVLEPWQAMDRCLGCTVAEDNYYKAQQADNDNLVRIVVDQPSEILINTDDHVVIAPAE